MEVISRCYGVIIKDGDYFNQQCIKELVSAALSMAILAGSVLLQVPQILNIMKSKSVEGISGTSLYASVVIPITFLAYNVLQGNPFATWGENVFSLIQNVILVVLYWRLSKPAVPTKNVLGITICFVVLSVGCFLLPKEHQGLLPLSTLPLIAASRVPQIVANYQNGHTGPLSVITFILVLLGNAARVYTTIMEVGFDLSLLANYGLSALFSGILAAQVVFYGYRSKKDKKA